jgi:hypothetical protein
MTSETDLSTADLAQPGGSRQPDRADDDRRESRATGDATAGTADRTYESSGNRVAQDPGDADTVELAPGGQRAGSTRDDALGGDVPAGGADGDMTDRGTGDRRMADGDMADRDAADRDAADRHMADRSMADRDMADRDMADRDMADRGMAGGGMSDRDTAGQGMAGQGMAGQGMAGQGMAGRGTVDGDAGDGRTADRGADTGGDVALLDPADAESFRRRWSDTQARFVDDPQEAVQTADGLVAELMQTLASSFSQHKGELESHWRSGGNPDTEDLRQALQRYRSFFDRLLSA